MKKILILLTAYFIFIFQSFAQAPDTLWTKTFGAEDSDYANSIEQTMDNGFIIYGTKNFNHWDHMDAWLVKTNNNGDTLWTKIFENFQPSGAVHQTLDGGYIMTRSKEFEFENGHLLVKINSLGEIDWEKPLAVEWVNSIEKTSDEGYILTGRSDEGVNLIKTDENGDIIWTKSFGRDSVYYNSNAIQTKDGGYALIISGHQYYSRLSVFYDMCLIKTLIT